MTNSAEKGPTGNERNVDEIARIESRLAQLGIANTGFVALRYTPKIQDKETGAWIDAKYPTTGEQVVLPALLPLEQIDVCPAPLSELRDSQLDVWLQSADSYRQDVIGDNEHNRAKAIEAGKMMINEVYEKRKNT